MRERARSRTSSAPERGSRRTSTVHPLLALQRTAGNRAVGALLARRGRVASDEWDLEAEADVSGRAAALGEGGPASIPVHGAQPPAAAPPAIDVAPAAPAGNAYVGEEELLDPRRRRR